MSLENNFENERYFDQHILRMIFLIDSCFGFIMN